MQQYQPIRYRHLKDAIDTARDQLDAVMRELAIRHGVGTPAFKKAASALADMQIGHAPNFKDLLARKRGMDKIHAAWEGGGSVIFDMNMIAGRDALLPEADGLVKSMIPAPDFYVHFGEEAGLRLQRRPEEFFDGMYVRAAKKDGLDQLRIVLVCNATGWQIKGRRSYGEAMTRAGRIAWGWAPFERPIPDSLRQYGMGGDLALLRDPRIMTAIDHICGTIGRLCAAEQEIVFKSSATRH